VKITEQTIIADILREAPQAKKALDRHGLACKGCQGATAESVARAARNHGLEPRVLLREILEAVKSAG